MQERARSDFATRARLLDTEVRRKWTAVSFGPRTSSSMHLRLGLLCLRSPSHSSAWVEQVEQLRRSLDEYRASDRVLRVIETKVRCADRLMPLHLSSS
jgi:hypothetical protein